MTALVAVLAVIVAVWFAAGTVWNVRRGSASLRWMQGGLPLLGDKTTVRWLGSTAVELCIRQAKAPFEEVTLLVFLEPRDVPWWPLSRLRGRRDTLIVRGQLRRAPRVRLEALAPRSWSGRDAQRKLLSDPALSYRAPSETLALETWTSAPEALARADELLQLAQGAGLEVRRLSVRPEAPQLQLHVALPSVTAPAKEFFGVVRALGERAPG